MTKEQAKAEIMQIYGVLSPSKQQALDVAIEALEQTRWIPISERLPDNTDDVLVYDYSDIFVAWYSGKHGNWFSADNRFDEYTPIIAWQPLPEPYEPQESEESDGDSNQYTR